MPKVMHVKRAQQRYATKPVLNEDGTQKQSPVMDKRTGAQKTTKGGRPVFLKITERDLDKPLPMPQCDAPGCEDREIRVRTPYKWIEPSGQRVRTRHEACPTWNVWDYSSSLSARIAQIQSNEVPTDLSEPGDATSWVEDVAGQIRELAEEKRESATNIEEPEDEDCDACGGTGEIEGEEADGPDVQTEPCGDCDGSGQVSGDEPTEEQMDEWREEVTEALQGALDECPV